MTKSKKYLTYAINPKGELVNVEDVPNGNDCNCICPYCHEALCAKHDGKIISHFFAHISKKDCEGAIESALHKMAKDILMVSKKLMLPGLGNNKNTNEVTFDVVEIEPYIKELDLRPDCIVTHHTGRKLWVEFKNTHALNYEKISKIISAKIDCIEIDLTECELNPDSVKDFLEKDQSNRKWIYSNKNVKLGYVPNVEFLDNFSDKNHYLKRHFALNENGDFIDLTNSKSFKEINIFEHTYYCMLCGKKQLIDMDEKGDYFFVHAEPKIKCEDKRYLCAVSKYILKDRFEASQGFSLFIPEKNNCNEKNDCVYYCENCFTIDFPEKKLQKPRYTLDELLDNEYKGILNKDENLILRSNDDQIILHLNCSRYSKTKNQIINNLRNKTLWINITSENNALALKNIKLKIGNVTYYNFLSQKEINNIIDEGHKSKGTLKFSIQSSHYYNMGYVKCPRDDQQSSIYEIEFCDDISIDIAKYMALWHCYKNHIDVCLCDICRHLRIGFNPLIKINCPYLPINNVQTLQIENYPINCSHFSFNKELYEQLPDMDNIHIQIFDFRK